MLLCDFIHKTLNKIYIVKYLSFDMHITFLYIVCLYIHKCLSLISFMKKCVYLTLKTFIKNLQLKIINYNNT